MTPLSVYVFDTSALVRYLRGEAGYEKVLAILNDGRDGFCRILISAVNWGELYYTVHRQLGSAFAAELQSFFAAYHLTIVEVGVEAAEASGKVKLKSAMGYADCFAVALTGARQDSVLVTSDFGFVAAERDVAIEFLPRLPVH